MVVRLGFVLGVSALAGSVSATTLYVDQACGDDAWSGTSRACVAPAGPKATIGAALADASAGDAIVIADGVYAEHDLDLAGRDLTIRSEHGADDCVIDCAYQGRAFLVAPKQGRDAQFIELTIRRGGSLTETMDGGAFNLVDASPTFRGCAFETCSVRGRGGAIYATGGAPAFLDCIFYRNSAHPSDMGYGGSGGAVMAMDSDTLIERCSFEDNDGGGAFYFIGGAARVTQCMITHPTTSNASSFIVVGPDVVITDCYVTGQMMVAQVAKATVEGCTFRGFSAGALLASGGAVIRRCTFEENRGPNPAATGGDGTTFEQCRFVENEGHRAGALQAEPGDTVLRDCLFLLNTSQTEGGAIQVTSGGRLTAVNCAFRGNFAVSRAGVVSLKAHASAHASATLVNCLLYGNSANFTTGGVYAPSDASVNIVNSIIWANTADTTGLPAQLTGPITVNYSCVQDWDDSLGGMGNFGADPGFVEPLGPDGIAGTGDENLLLQPGSPCIDAGDSSAIEPYPTLDLTGRARFFDDLATPDTGVPSALGATVDLGPTEYLGWEALHPGDTNCDGAITPADVNLFVSALRYPNGQGWPANCPWLHADLDGDGRVTFADISILRAWLTP